MSADSSGPALHLPSQRCSKIRVVSPRQCLEALTGDPLEPTYLRRGGLPSSLAHVRSRNNNLFAHTLNFRLVYSTRISVYISVAGCYMFEFIQVGRAIINNVTGSKRRDNKRRQIGKLAILSSSSTHTGGFLRFFFDLSFRPFVSFALLLLPARSFETRRVTRLIRSRTVDLKFVKVEKA